MEKSEVFVRAKLLKTLIKDYVSSLLKDNNLQVKKSEDYLRRFTCIQGWFIRCSNHRKFYFLKELISVTQNLNIITTVLAVLFSSECKDRIYCISQNLNLFYNDIMFIDDNRCLDENILEQAMLNEIKWYKILSNGEQLHVLLNLLQLMDTAIHNILSKEIKLILQNRKHFLETDNKPINSKNSSLPEYFCYDANIDSNNLMFGEYNKIFLNWYTFITNFKNVVEPKVDHPIIDSEKGKKRPHIDTTDKNKADEIQMLPIWVTLKILSRLNQNDLKKLDKVNDYWRFAIKEVQQCIKSRKLLDQAISNMTSKINTTSVPRKQAIDITLRKKNAFVINTNPSLRRKFQKKRNTTDSWNTNVYKQYIEHDKK